jgi:hypothetical protein
MKRLASVCGVVWLLPLMVQAQGPTVGQAAAADRHPAALVAFANDLRAWQGAKSNQVPDYVAEVKASLDKLAEFHQRLDPMPWQSWPVHARVDFLVLRSELDDQEFDLRVVRQVSRNPDFYTTQAVQRVYHLIGGRYQAGPGITVPYDAKRAAAIIQALNDTKAIVSQAPKGLTEPVGEMADMATTRLVDVRKHYHEFAELVGQYLPEPYRGQIGPAADAAGAALEEYGNWIKAHRATMKAPMAIGTKAFEWYTQRVLMMPYNSEQLLTQAQTERVRNWTFLEFELLKNKQLPPIVPAKDNAQFADWKIKTDKAAREWAEKYGLFTKPDYIGEMQDEDGGVWIEPFGLMGFPKTPKPVGSKTEFLVPPDHWFSHIYWEKGHRLDPGTNHPHSDYPGHTFENAVSRRTTCELRRGHNTRGDSWTTYMEEMQLQLDYPFVQGARAREWMYSLAIMRSERVYIAVKFAAGEMTPEQVADHYMKNVPGMEPYVAMKHEVWRKFVDPAQVLTYQVGKNEIYTLMADEMMRLGDKFDIKAFHDALLATGQIPVSLARWEMTGHDDDVRALFSPSPLSDVLGAAATAHR